LVGVEPGGLKAWAVLRLDGARRTVTQVFPAEAWSPAGFLDGTLLWTATGDGLVLRDVATKRWARLHSERQDLLPTEDGTRLVGLDWTTRELFVLDRESLQRELVVSLPESWREDADYSASPRWIVPNELVLVTKEGGFGAVDLSGRTATGDVSALQALVLPEPGGTVALLSIDPSSSGAYTSNVWVWDARSGTRSSAVALGPPPLEGQPVLAVAPRRRFIALNLFADDPSRGDGRVDLHVFDGKTGARIRRVPGPRVDWGQFSNVAVTREGVVCSAHRYPMRGGTCEAKALFDLRSLTVAQPPAGVRCIVRGGEARPAVVGSAAPGRNALGSGGFGGRFGEVCNEALSPNGDRFARVEVAAGADRVWALGRDLHLRVFDARSGKRRADIPLGDPPDEQLNSLWLEFVGDSVVDVSVEHGATWRVDLAKGDVLRGPAPGAGARSPAGRWVLDDELFDFDTGTTVAWPWWTDVDPEALAGYSNGHAAIAPLD
jgi:hypothetical protein